MLYAFLISVACPYILTRLGFINVIFGEAYDKLWSSSLCNFLHPFIIFSILDRKIILNICSAKFYNYLRYPNISDSTESSKSIVCILQLSFIKMYLFYCQIILLFSQYRKLYHVIYVNDESKRILNESVVDYS